MWGAATWMHGTSGKNNLGGGPGIRVSTANSLCGQPYDNACYGGVALTDGNYVVLSPQWKNGTTIPVGAATWMHGMSGKDGNQAGPGVQITTTNSLLWNYPE